MTYENQLPNSVSSLGIPSQLSIAHVAVVLDLAISKLHFCSGIVIFTAVVTHRKRLDELLACSDFLHDGKKIC